MGCGLTKEMNRKRTETAPVSVDDLKNRLLEEYKHVQKRFGHPTYYKQNGYDLGLRIDGHERYQSFYLGTSKLNGTKAMVKEHHLTHCAESDIITEVLILANLSHRALPELYEVFITDQSVFTVSSHIESSRLSHVMDCRPGVPSSLSLNDTRLILKTIIEAVEHCHSKNVIVRNLTPANIVCKKTNDGFIVKIADFSMAVMNGCTDYLCDSKYFGWHQVGCMAPEALLGNTYSYSMDMWGVGVLLFLMITNTMPFVSDDDTALMHMITHSDYVYPKNCNPPSNVKYLISQLLFVSTEVRLNGREALRNAWLTPVHEEDVHVADQ